MIKNDNDFNTIVELKKFIIAQLVNSKDCNMEYRLCVDYLHNHKNEKYRKFIMDKTGLSASEIFKSASKFIQEISNYIFTKLEELTMEEKAVLMNEPKALEKFLETVNGKIKETNHGLFVQRASSN